jgi:hypothetical protein
MSDDETTFDCEGCGTILEVGEEHDCPVLGTIVTITPKDRTMDERHPIDRKAARRGFTE